ncbi:MAG: hypothetical protein BAJALOKI2v1_630017 [Promethearchaeota archaeon]|nr:MAG: hypothetical protein BAJALOKI2v1_630017 [Candidatus Lokiarchaeota archaeon]
MEVNFFFYLSEKSTFSGTQDEPGNYIDFGRLPAQSGTFITIMNITIEDIKKYGSVLIWCEPFKVVFTYASLEHVK